ARLFRLRMESLEVDTVGYCTDIRGCAKQACIFIGHYDHTLVAGENATLITMPPPPVPPCRDGTFALPYLVIEVERDIVFDEDITLVGRELGVLHLQQTQIVLLPVSFYEASDIRSAIFPHFRRQQCRPARLAIHRLREHNDFRARTGEGGA